MRARVHECKGHKKVRGAECGVQHLVPSAKCGVQLLSADRNFSAVQEHCLSEKPLPFATRHSLPFRRGKRFTPPFFPLTEVGVYKKRSLLKQADTKMVASCRLRVQRKKPNPQLSTLNPQLQ